MKNHKKSLLGLLLVFCVLGFCGCIAIKPVEIETTAATTIEATTLAPGTYIGGPSVDIITYEELDLNDFLDNPDMNAEENERLKRITIDVVLYIFGFDVDFDDILEVVDVQASKEWYAQYFDSWIKQAPEERVGWTIIDDIRSHRKFHDESPLEIESIQTDFMLRRVYGVNMPIWLKDGGYVTYDFTFVEVDGELMLIGLFLGG